MHPFYIFFIRLILSIILAFFIGRFFFQDASIIKIIGLGLILFILAYLFEFTRKRDKGGENGN